MKIHCAIYMCFPYVKGLATLRQKPLPPQPSLFLTLEGTKKLCFVIWQHFVRLLTCWKIAINASSLMEIIAKSFAVRSWKITTKYMYFE